MKQLDLIIDALEKLDNQAHVNDMDLIAEALAAARELKTLKPVAWLVSDAQGRYATIRDPSLYKEEVYEPLYTAPPQQELAKPEQEPVAWAAKSIYGDFEGLSFEKQPRFDTPLYALEVTK